MHLKSAQSIVTHALKNAEDKDLQIAIAVTDAHGELVCFARTDEVSPQAKVLAQNKAYTAARDRQNSGQLGSWAQATGKDMSYWTDARITGIAGGVPIYKSDRVIGAVGISGLSEAEDERLAQQLATFEY